MIRVLQVFHKMGNGGIEHYIMNCYRNIDRQRVQFDFLTSVEEPGYFDEEIHQLGGRTYRVRNLKKNPIHTYQDISKIVREESYQIVHRHTGSAFGYFELHAARKGGAKHLILHAHNTEAGKNYIHQVSRHLLKMPCISVACSQEAGEFLFGKRVNFQVFPNPIDCEVFQYSPEIRERVREKLGVEDCFVAGHIGRFAYQKNHEFLMQIWKELIVRKPGSILLCIGDGSLRKEIEDKAKQLGISDNVRFLGQRDDVSLLMQAFDLFLLPSHYEGFGIVLLEAQANGLQCVASDVVPGSVNVTENVTYLPLSEPAEVWADLIAGIDTNRDLKANHVVMEKGYDIHIASEKLRRFYEQFA